MLLRTSQHVLGPDLLGLSLSGISTYQSTVLGIAPASLIAYWPLTETGGTQASDVSGNARHGTYSGVTLAQIAGPGPSMGMAGLWDGVNDYVNVFSASLATAFDKNLHTLALWAKVSAAGVWADGAFRKPLALNNAANDTQGKTGFFKNSAANALNIEAQGGGTGSSVIATTSTEAWFHLAIVVGPTTATGFFNGVQVASPFARGTWSQALAAASIGSQSNITNFWSGYLAHVAIWNADLSAQIATLATAR